MEGVKGRVALWFENHGKNCFFFPFRSDVLGQFMPLVGKDWTQSGVARLFCAIKVCIFFKICTDIAYVHFNWNGIVMAKI